MQGNTLGANTSVQMSTILSELDVMSSAVTRIEGRLCVQMQGEEKMKEVSSDKLLMVRNALASLNTRLFEIENRLTVIE